MSLSPKKAHVGVSILGDKGHLRRSHSEAPGRTVSNPMHPGDTQSKSLISNTAIHIFICPLFCRFTYPLPNKYTGTKFKITCALKPILHYALELRFVKVCEQKRKKNA